MVIRGYEQDAKGEQTDSPTLSRNSIKFLLWLAAFMGWLVEAWDVRKAFQQTDTRNDPTASTKRIWLRPPANVGLVPGMAWLLCVGKTLYGLRSAPHTL